MTIEQAVTLILYLGATLLFGFGFFSGIVDFAKLFADPTNNGMKRIPMLLIAIVISGLVTTYTLWDYNYSSPTATQMFSKLIFPGAALAVVRIFSSPPYRRIIGVSIFVWYATVGVSEAFR